VRIKIFVCFFKFLKKNYFSKSAVDLRAGVRIANFGTKLKLKDFSMHFLQNKSGEKWGQCSKLTFNKNKMLNFFVF